MIAVGDDVSSQLINQSVNQEVRCGGRIELSVCLGDKGLVFLSLDR